MEKNIERRIPVFKLLKYAKELKRLYSFSGNIDRCNFTFYSGWGGKTYVTDLGHSVAEYKPVLRGVELFNLFYLKLTDYVVLTEEQYKDYKIITGIE